NVASSGFGMIMDLPVDGNVYTEPLFLRSLAFADGVTHNVVIVATENDSIYEFDADSGALIWMRNLTDPAHGLTAMPSTAVSCHNVYPTVGITGTPAIERATNTMYLVAKFKQSSGQSFTIRQELRALSLTTGADAHSPAVIAASLRMHGGGTATFDARWQLQRPGLLLEGGNVYIAFGSHCDRNSAVSRGWVLAYDERTLAQTAAFSTALDLAPSYISGVW